MTNDPPPPGCAICRGTALDHLDRETAMVRSAFDARLLRCRSCATVFAWPQPASVDDAYEEEYFGAYDDAGMLQLAEANPRRFAERLQRAHPRPGRLLDVGVGQGAFLNEAKRLGWEVLGLDVSRWAARHVRDRFGIEVLTGTLDAATLGDRTFDVVHMSHVLEHLPSPAAALAVVGRLIGASGRVIIEVPNELENIYTWLRLRSGTASPYRVPSTHLWFFSPATLRRVVVDAGFRIEALRAFRETDDASAVRRVAKVAVAGVENVLGRGPLIELVASRQ
jgi:2-polyprenyl-3-methyl-5-hydroxy-6-metoxy-1,4-benzoquinol methylase